jgi:hypothetical protein
MKRTQQQRTSFWLLIVACVERISVLDFQPPTDPPSTCATSTTSNTDVTSSLIATSSLISKYANLDY